MTDNAQKTPCSLLQELCITNDLEPTYQLLTVEGAVHAPTFTYRASVKTIEATAAGNSKKKAKHAAAKAVLEQLLSEKGEFKDGFESEGVVVNSQTLNDIIAEALPVPTVEEDNSKNPVGQLQELCMKKKWASPYYEKEKDEGLPHDKVFTLSCQLEKPPEKFITYGEAKSKRIAKRLAAENMVNKLLAMNIVTQEDFDEKKKKPEDPSSNLLENCGEEESKVEETHEDQSLSVSNTQEEAVELKDETPNEDQQKNTEEISEQSNAKSGEW